MQSLKIDRVKETTEQLRLTSVMAANEIYWGEKDYAASVKEVPTFDPKRDITGPLDLGVTVEKGASQDPNVKLQTSRLVVFGGGSFLSDRGLQQAPVAASLVVNTFNWLLSRETLVGIAPKAKERTAYSLSEAQLAKIAQWVCLYIPLFIGIFGLYHLWWRHGKNLFSLTFWLAIAFLASILIWYGLLISLGVENLKNIPKGIYIAIATAVVIGLITFLIHQSEQRKKAAALS
jgi:hypothetical protein